MRKEKLLVTLAHKLKKENFLLVTAESCTGGGLAYLITQYPACSSILERGYITYSNEAKIELLHVSADTLAHYGPVSAQTAQEMAEGALTQSHAQLSIAITGLAGPNHDGQSNEPIGKIYIACACNHKKTQVHEKKFSGTRKFINNMVITEALSIAIAMLD